jgi:hypothetical protein
MKLLSRKQLHSSELIVLLRRWLTQYPIIHQRHPFTFKMTMLNRTCQKSGEQLKKI